MKKFVAVGFTVAGVIWALARGRRPAENSWAQTTDRV